jgi:hypothetical protein
MQSTANNQLNTLGIQARFYLGKRTLKDILAISFPLHLFVLHFSSFIFFFSFSNGLLRIGLFLGGSYIYS